MQNRSDVNRTRKKLYKQKGTGNARHGAASAPQFRGGGRAFGPVVRDHSHDLPKKVRALALRHALSSKAKAETLIVVDDIAVDNHKTKGLIETFGKLGLSNALIIGGAEVDVNFGRAARPSRRSTCCPSRASTSTTSCAATSSCSPRRRSTRWRSVSNEC